MTKESDPQGMKQMQVQMQKQMQIDNGHRRCMEEAALTLKSLTHILHQPPGEGAGAGKDDADPHTEGNAITGGDANSTQVKTEANTNTNTNTANIMDGALRIKCIVALTESLTGVLPHSKRMDHDAHAHLDHGEECMQALLSCMEALVWIRTPTSTSMNFALPPQDRAFASSMESTMNGQLMFQMVQCCLTILGDREDDDDDVDGDTFRGSDRIGSTSLGLGMRNNDIKGNVGLKIQALRTLDALLRIGIDVLDHKGMDVDVDESSSDGMIRLWRAMFPGVFKVRVIGWIFALCSCMIHVGKSCR